MDKPFTEETFRALIRESISGGYEFVTFQDLKCEIPRAVYLRHDIDVDVGAALWMARIEADLGIRSTYFLMLRSPVYNLLSRENNDMAIEIRELGHEIGLHFDQGYLEGKDVDLNRAIEGEAAVLQEVLGVDVGAVSFHQPSERIISNEIAIANYINTYSKEDMGGIYYLSDTNMRFREDIFGTIRSGVHSRLQILIHPVWWGREETEPEKIWMWAMAESFERMQRQLLATERAYGKRKRISFTNEP